MKRWLSVVVLCAAACGPSAGAVTREMFGDKWPLTIAAGTLRCETDGARKYVTLETDQGIDYALNGAARAFGYRDAKAIMKPDTTPAGLQPLIDRGLTLCR